MTIKDSSDLEKVENNKNARTRGCPGKIERLCLFCNQELYTRFKVYPSLEFIAKDEDFLMRISE